ISRRRFLVTEAAVGLAYCGLAGWSPAFEEVAGRPPLPLPFPLPLARRAWACWVLSTVLGGTSESGLSRFGSSALGALLNTIPGAGSGRRLGAPGSFEGAKRPASIGMFGR